MTLPSLVRTLLLVVAGVLAAGGILLLVAAGSPDAIFGALWMFASAAILAAVAIFERSRYRDEATEGERGSVGPGGTPATEHLEPRFRPTDEVFVDPTSGRRMRVWLDGNTGERRYRAEG